MLMISDSILKYLERVKEICLATENELSEYTGSENLQFPTLLSNIATKFNWDERQTRSAEPHVRDYVRCHPDWYVTRGA